MSGGRIIIPRRRRRDILAEYRNFAAPENDLHFLSGRSTRLDRTLAMNRLILNHMDFALHHRVLDIGCGDASLLASIAPKVAGAVGTVVTPEERDRLKAAEHLAAIEFYSASFTELSAIPGKFDRVIVNGALHLVRTRGNGRKAFKSIADLLAPGGKLWIGELPTKPARKIFTSRIAAVRHVRRRHGFIFAFAFLRHIWRHRARSSQIIEMGAPLWIVQPEELAVLAVEHRLRIEGAWNCAKFTGDSFYLAQDRMSYILSKTSD